jgi:hypothetical protein
MIVRPMLGDWELPCIQRVELQQARRQARLGIPGLVGDLHQDLGAESLTIAITGSLGGDDTRSDLLDHLHKGFSSGEPQPFVADIVDSSELEDVVVVGFDVVETDEWTDAVRYRIVLRQYVEPPQPPSLSSDLGLDDLADLKNLADSLLDGLDLPGLLGGVPSLSDPSEPIKPAMKSVESAVGSLPDMLGSLGKALGVDG